MTWLLVAGDFTPLGGMDRANYALARYLARHGDIHLVTHRAWPDLAALPRVRIHRVWRPLNRHLLGAPLLARSSERVRRRLGRDVRVVTNGGNSFIAGANWVHYVHAAYEPAVRGSAATRARIALMYRRNLKEERRALRQASLVICNSERTRRDVVERVGVDASRTIVTYYGSDPAEFPPVTEAERVESKRRLGLTGDRPVLGFVGALGDRRKAFDSVFDAWTDLCRSPQWDADLVVVGAGSELARWRARAARADLDRRIRFLGFRDDVPQLLAAFDGLVHPARYEAYGLAAAEAICRGVPVLVSRAAGVAERYPSDLADLLIDNPSDPAELFSRLSWWRSNLDGLRPRIQTMSNEFRARTWDLMSAEIAAAVERCQ